MILVTEDIKTEAMFLGVDPRNVIAVKPYEEYEYAGITIQTVPAYNKYKEFHPKEKNWVGYIIEIDDVRYYIAGDTDDTKEAAAVECDVAFLPVGGTYTMDYIEAAHLAVKLSPEYVIPTHYGSIVGHKEDGILFKDSFLVLFSNVIFNNLLSISLVFSPAVIMILNPLIISKQFIKM